MAEDLVQLLLEEVRAGRIEVRALTERVAKLEITMAAESSAGGARRSQLVELGRTLIMLASVVVAVVAVATR